MFKNYRSLGLVAFLKVRLVYSLTRIVELTKFDKMIQYYTCDSSDSSSRCIDEIENIF